MRGVLPVETVVRALENEGVTMGTPGRADRAGWLRLFGALPSMGAALMPVGACPACWPLYAGLLGSVGLAFLLDATYLLPLTAAFLALALGSLAYRASARRGYGPLLLGVVAVGIILLGKFLLASGVLVYLGLTILVGTSVWNAWPLRTGSSPSCPQCAPGEAGERFRSAPQRR